MPPSASRLVITLALTERCNYSPPGSEVQPARRVFVLFCVCSVLKPFPEPLGRPECFKPLQMFTGNRSAPQPGLLLRHTDREMLSEVTFSKLLLLWVVKNSFQDQPEIWSQMTSRISCVIILSFLYLRAGAKPSHNYCAILCLCFCCLFCFSFLFLIWSLAWTRMVLNSLCSQVGLKLVIPPASASLVLEL